MPWYVVNGQPVHLLIRGKKAPKQCRAPVDGPGRQTMCYGIGSLLCDWPVDEGRHTCDMPLCAEHGVQVGKDRHYCPEHLAKHRSAEPEIF